MNSKSSTVSEVKSLIKSLRSTLKIHSIEDFGATVKLDERCLSEGCNACKNGSWICVHIGYSCQLRCAWCPHDFSQYGLHNDPVNATGGDLSMLKRSVTIEDIIEIVERIKISGISFSGGEPTLYVDKITEWAKKIKRHDSSIYLWLYTNGVDLDTNIVQKLGHAGIDEIRFDLAAVNYSQNIVEKLAYVKKYVAKSCVEVPVIREQCNLLIACLGRLDALHVDYLNLHDLYLNSQLIKNTKKKLIYIDELTKVQRYIPSIRDVYAVLRHIQKSHLNLITNCCDVVNMVNQLVGFKYQQFLLQQGVLVSFDEYRRIFIKKYGDKCLLEDNEDFLSHISG
jgi:pyruvate formate-lyase activating enzyme-like uncharacterized protein